MIPSDPMILLSYVNLKLRDEYSSLEEMCDKMDISKSEIEDKLAELSGGRFGQPALLGSVMAEIAISDMSSPL